MHQKIDDDKIFEPERNFSDVFSKFTLQLLIKGNTIEFSPIQCVLKNLGQPKHLLITCFFK